MAKLPELTQTLLKAQSAEEFADTLRRSWYGYGAPEALDGSGFTITLGKEVTPKTFYDAMAFLKFVGKAQDGQRIYRLGRSPYTVTATVSDTDIAVDVSGGEGESDAGIVKDTAMEIAFLEAYQKRLKQGFADWPDFQPDEGDGTWEIAPGEEAVPEGWPDVAPIEDKFAYFRENATEPPAPLYEQTGIPFRVTWDAQPYDNSMPSARTDQATSLYIQTDADEFIIEADAEGRLLVTGPKGTLSAEQLTVNTMVLRDIEAEVPIETPETPPPAIPPQQPPQEPPVPTTELTGDWLQKMRDQQNAMVAPGIEGMLNRMTPEQLAETAAEAFKDAAEWGDEFLQRFVTGGTFSTDEARWMIARDLLRQRGLFGALPAVLGPGAPGGGAGYWLYAAAMLGEILGIEKASAYPAYGEMWARWNTQQLADTAREQAARQIATAIQQNPLLKTLNSIKALLKGLGVINLNPVTQLPEDLGNLQFEKGPGRGRPANEVKPPHQNIGDNAKGVTENDLAADAFFLATGQHPLKATTAAQKAAMLKMFPGTGDGGYYYVPDGYWVSAGKTAWKANVAAVRTQDMMAAYQKTPEYKAQMVSLIYNVGIKPWAQNKVPVVNMPQGREVPIGTPAGGEEVIPIPKPAAPVVGLTVAQINTLAKQLGISAANVKKLAAELKITKFSNALVYQMRALAIKKGIIKVKK